MVSYYIRRSFQFHITCIIRKSGNSLQYDWYPKVDPES
jgi:hypothetical protein